MSAQLIGYGRPLGGEGGGAVSAGSFYGEAAAACRTGSKQQCNTFNEQVCNTVQEQKCEIQYMNNRAAPAVALEVLVSPVAVRLWLSLLVVKIVQFLELAQLSQTMLRPKLKHAQLFMRMSAIQ